MKRLLLAFVLCAGCDKKADAPKTEAAKVTDADPPAASEHHDGPALAYAGDAEQATARLTVGDADEFALIIVDGVTRGTTPRTADNPIPLAPGTHHVEIRQLPSGPSQSYDITVKPNETFKLIERK